MSKAIKVIVLRVGQAPVVETIPADVTGDGHLKAMQALVGGYIECVGNFDGRGADLWCNEEGMLLELPLNRTIPAPPAPEPPPGFEVLYADDGLARPGEPGEWRIRGDFFIARATDDGDLDDVTEEDIKYYADLFATADAQTAFVQMTTALASRGDYIANAQCIPAPFGCGGPATEFRDDLSRVEYRITAQCQACQDKIYAELAELESEPLSSDGEPLS